MSSSNYNNEQQQFNETSTGDIPRVHEGHVSAGSQLNPGAQGFSGVDMAAETAKFDNAYGAVPGHQEQGYSSTTSGLSGSQGLSGSEGLSGSHGLRESQGLTGGQGYSDSQGLTGSQNYSSTQGVTGSQGYSDSQGLTGSHHSHQHGSSGLTGAGVTSGTTGSGAYQGSTEHQHSSHGTHGHHNQSEQGSYSGNKEEQREQMKEEKKEAAAEKKEELKHRNNQGESKTDIAKDEYNKAGNKADHETADGHKPGMMDKIKAAVKSL